MRASDGMTGWSGEMTTANDSNDTNRMKGEFDRMAGFAGWTGFGSGLNRK